MSSEVEIHLKAYDEASDVIAGVGANMQNTLNDVEGSTQGLVTANEQASVSFQDAASSMGTLAMSGMSLYMSYFMVEKAQVQVDRANLMVQRSTESLEKAQTAYNDAVVKYGDNSTQAQAALDKLNIAQNAYSVATERAQLSSQNLNNSMIYMGLSVVPTIIGTIASLSKIMESLNITTAAGTALKLSEVPAYVGATVASAAHAIAEGIETVATWLLVTATATELALVTLGIGLVVAATAVTLFLATAQHGAAGATDELNSSLDLVDGALTQATATTKTYNEETVGFINAQTTASQIHAKIVAGQLADQQAAAAAQAELAKASADELKNLTTRYDELGASADKNLAIIKKEFDIAFNRGDMNAALEIVKTFANQYGVSLSYAEQTIEKFKAAQAEVPKSIEEQLVGKAQADMDNFKNCMTGKSLTLSTDVAGNMSKMAGDVTDLINHGLVGEAQDAIKAYVDCNTNKVASMTMTIANDITTLTKNYNDQLTQMKTLAAALTGQEKDAVLAEIDSMTSQYIVKINQLQTWQDLIFSQIKTQTTAQITDMTTNVIGQMRRLSDQAVALSIWPDMLELMNRQTEEGLGAVEKRFGKMSDTVLGNMPSAPATMIPNALGGSLGRGGASTSIVNHVYGPLVTIEGSADRATAELAATQVMEKLKTIIVEPSSMGVGPTMKRIRKAALF